MNTIGGAITEAAKRLADVGISNPRREARLLAGVALEKSATQIFNSVDEPISPENQARLDQHVQRRSAGEPFAYIAGEREFWSLPFLVTPDTLIPRPDTETVIELAVKALKDEPPRRILDIGTGSGCLLVALLSEFRAANGVGVDVSEAALMIARQNADRNEVGDRCHFIASSWLDNVEGAFDLIVSNPPYIPTADIDGLSIDVRAHEPRLALDGGQGGLDAYEHIFNNIDRVLKKNASVIVEIGIDQQRDVTLIAETRGFSRQETKNDSAGVPRALIFRKKSVGNLGGKV